ncbi:hypothetical protein P7K49_007752 [Saguinus oedipus]|uniref:MHC class II beta chain N-terminal domain-containing protein n=1 Tax=Saguinus oedipus TaxID=9490 RepID=A0ABQ9VVR8_SAGOE|nr:hypothetical protein P7K49_007752 [Saguinus oedipus]
MSGSSTAIHLEEDYSQSGSNAFCGVYDCFYIGIVTSQHKAVLVDLVGEEEKSHAQGIKFFDQEPFVHFPLVRTSYTTPGEMDSRWLPWVVALLVNLTRLDSSVTQGTDSPEDFVIQAKADCYFTNGTENVQFVVRFIFNLEEYAHFDSDVGMFVALTKLGQPDADQWNSRLDLLERSREAVDTVCRHNYRLGAPFTVRRKVQPEVTVYPERTPLLHQHNLLLCSVTGFYPGDIKISN